MLGREFEYIELITLILGIYYLYCSIRWMTKKENHPFWRMEIPFFVLISTIVIYYSVLEIDRLDNGIQAVIYADLSAVLRLVTVAILLAVLFYRSRGKRKGG